MGSPGATGVGRGRGRPRNAVSRRWSRSSCTGSSGRCSWARRGWGAGGGGGPGRGGRGGGVVGGEVEQPELGGGRGGELLGPVRVGEHVDEVVVGLVVDGQSCTRRGE